MSLTSPYENYLRRIHRYETPKKEVEVNEAISVSLNSRQVKRVLAEKIRTVANRLEEVYVVVKASENEYSSPQAVLPGKGEDPYSRRQEKIAKSQEAEIKKLIGEVEAFEASINKCISALYKAETIKESVVNESINTDDSELNAHTSKMKSKYKSDPELSKFLRNVDKTVKKGGSNSELYGHIKTLMNLMTARGQKPTPEQEKMFAKLSGQMEKTKKK